MNHINPTALFLIAFTTGVGALMGAWVLGLVIGTGIVLFATLVGW